mmetsp:Transcript_13077/g.31597  ORF Transcript_13077/g.31597 Transcript_13077/m.31597 type:complete len:356 (-) Transcript_13077:487-1554(-)
MPTGLCISYSAGHLPSDNTRAIHDTRKETGAANSVLLERMVQVVRGDVRVGDSQDLARCRASPCGDDGASRSCFAGAWRTMHQNHSTLQGSIDNCSLSVSQSGGQGIRSFGTSCCIMGCAAIKTRSSARENEGSATVADPVPGQQLCLSNWRLLAQQDTAHRRAKRFTPDSENGLDRDNSPSVGDLALQEIDWNPVPFQNRIPVSQNPHSTCYSLVLQPCFVNSRSHLHSPHRSQRSRPGTTKQHNIASANCCCVQLRTTGHHSFQPNVGTDRLNTLHHNLRYLVAALHGFGKGCISFCALQKPDSLVQIRLRGECLQRLQVVAGQLRRQRQRLDYPLPRLTIQFVTRIVSSLQC